MPLERGVLQTLGSLFDVVDDVRWPKDQLYVDGKPEEWSPESLSAIVEVDPYEEEPPVVLLGAVSLAHALAGFHVVEVVENMHREGLSPSPELFADALRFFFVHDSFLRPER